MKEKLIFARGKWEIARVEINATNRREQWVRRDTSWICYVGDEVATMPMPENPQTKEAAK